jgi:catechol 2,3-dioxygenase-like lactoylglutathione lyase family enzyme
MKVRGIDHVVFVVSDIEKSLDWYRSLLELDVERLDRWRAKEVIFVSLRIDDTTIIDLFEGEPEPGRVGHIALLVEDVDLAAVAGREDLDVEMGPTTLWGAQGNGTGIYVRDPDGNRIELRTYG